MELSYFCFNLEVSSLGNEGSPSFRKPLIFSTLRFLQVSENGSIKQLVCVREQNFLMLFGNGRLINKTAKTL